MEAKKNCGGWTKKQRWTLAEALESDEPGWMVMCSSANGGCIKVTAGPFKYVVESVDDTLQVRPLDQDWLKPAPVTKRSSTAVCQVICRMMRSHVQPDIEATKLVAGNVAAEIAQAWMQAVERSLPNGRLNLIDRRAWAPLASRIEAFVKGATEELLS